MFDYAKLAQNGNVPNELFHNNAFLLMHQDKPSLFVIEEKSEWTK